MAGSAFLDGKTALVIVDMVNGFLTEGVLSSPRSASVLPECEKLLQFFAEHHLPCVAFADCHEPECLEFQQFPPHCLKNTSESQLAPSLQKIGGYVLIEKNSTNGFFAPEFQEFFRKHDELENFLVCGVCTDICVMQFCLTLKTFCNQQNKPVQIIVPVNAVETYDAPNHSAEKMQNAAFDFLMQSGVNLVCEVNIHESF